MFVIYHWSRVDGLAWFSRLDHSTTLPGCILVRHREEDWREA
jgi:hypothetical protein